MSDWLGFTGRIEPLVLGDKTYTILRLPPQVDAVLSSAGVERVDVEIDDLPVNLAVVRSPSVDGAFLWAGQSLLHRIAAEPSRSLDVRLRPAPADHVDTPEDIAAALSRGGLLAAWEMLTPGKRRGLIYRIGTAKTQATRDKRIDALLRDLAADP